MKKTILITTLFLSSNVQAAHSCHHYAVWHYRFPQSCNARFQAMSDPPLPHIRIEKPRMPEIIAPPLHEPDPIFIHDNLKAILNAGVNTGTAIADIPVDILYEILREKAIEDLKTKMH